MAQPPGVRTGAAFGNPYGIAHPSGSGVFPSEQTLAAARYQGQRLATVTAQLLAGRRD